MPVMGHGIEFKYFDTRPIGIKSFDSELIDNNEDRKENQ
jgi:hypothetical protein